MPADPADDRYLAVPLIDVVHPDGQHVYYSTHCRHDNHAACDATELNGAPRRPAECKTCGAPCVCPHHTQAAERPAAR